MTMLSRRRLFRLAAAAGALVAAPLAKAAPKPMAPVRPPEPLLNTGLTDPCHRHTWNYITDPTHSHTYWPHIPVRQDGVFHTNGN